MRSGIRIYELLNLRLQDIEYHNHVFIRAQNVGSKPVTLISPKLSMPGTMAYAPDLQTGTSKWKSNVSFPHELMPAKSCSVYAPMEDVKVTSRWESRRER
jgi:integrase